ncbi:coiled-coil protein (macronuclear) [Tetrahymena thermophila SB210]|uniref:Coiled-coil protein n=1 Tax=Tetrahymena thermophila (strain SB210) TaxID=312017 RepID=I7LWN1_TETTS|nr:coiled-coil protein [Tetrahymena thermophila SB210]EAS02398.1 coiled-coil protein [Tetrahymena thermophila SB210]|eukprot:XP_001022643.1 coiled-coil protein [Tetrahymena thermophila SB210]
MVFYYTSSDGHLLYMGRDKFENEELIKYGWDEDIWFHVDDLSSAHVYLRLNEGEEWTNIDEKLIQECCQLVKENSIQGKKKDKVDIVYTPWSNLHKTNNMEVGAIGFHSENLRKKVRDITRDKDIVKAIIKTEREEEKPDFRDLKEKHILELKRKRFKEFKEQQKKEDEENKQKLLEKQSKNYNYLNENKEMMTSNKNAPDDDEDFI